jgi:hypothetical protein
MDRYVVQVDTASHDDLKTRVLVARRSKVVVLADSDADAVLLATQIAACTSGAMPVAAALLDFPT